MKPTRPPINLAKVQSEYQSFTHQFASLLMATSSIDGIPNASYAPYVIVQGDYYVFISELSAHTQNLKQNNALSVLFIEDECRAKQIFARQRVTYQCHANKIDRQDERFDAVIKVLTERFGDIISMLDSLKDFHLFRLHPIKGTYVQGFARAFAIEGENLQQVRHINDTGHKKAQAEAGNSV